MRESRPVAPVKSGGDSFAPAASIPDGGLSAMRVLASAAHISGSRLATGSRPAQVAGAAAGGRIDLTGLTTAPPLERATVTGAGGRSAGNHVGGAMLPPARNTVALSDGTRISFGAVAEASEFEYA